MKDCKAGCLYYERNINFDYYTTDFKTFYEEKHGNELTNDDLIDWAVWLNSPWSQAHEQYTISLNCKSAYIEMDETIPMWKCEYSIVGCDGIIASVFGYGNTEIESLESCKEHFNMLQKKYNQDNVSI